MTGMRRFSLLVLAATALPLTGCCSLARLFCGPDRSPWVSVDFQSPELAVRTFLEALRRDNATVAYECLSESFRTRLGIDESMTRLIWPKIREQNPGLHLAGYADVAAPTIDPKNPDRAGVLLNVEGTEIGLNLVRQFHWEVRYQRPGDDVPAAMRDAIVGSPVPGIDIGSFVEVKLTGQESEVSDVIVAPLRVRHFNIDRIPLANIRFAGVERTWRIDSVTTFLPNR
jgi:hypothetical protein